MNRGFDTTQFAYFDYDPAGSNPADIKYEGGDSGSPSFVMVNGKPALVGNASSLDTVDGKERSSIALVPAYLTEFDAMMESSGYHLSRANVPVGLALRFR